MACELCGEKRELFISIIEGVKLNVCNQCSTHGRVVKETKVFNETRIRKAASKNLIEEGIAIRQNYGELIKISREKLGLRQDELSNKLAIKESLLRSIENNKMEPSLNLAKKIELFLGVKIIEEFKIDNSMKPDKKNGTLTIGDLIKSSK